MGEVAYVGTSKTIDVGEVGEGGFGLSLEATAPSGADGKASSGVAQPLKAQRAADNPVPPKNRVTLLACPAGAQTCR